MIDDLSNKSENGIIGKYDSTADYHVSCISCGATDKLELCPHRNGYGMMVGLVFACNGCKDIVKGLADEYEKGVKDGEEAK